VQVKYLLLQFYFLRILRDMCIFSHFSNIINELELRLLIKLFSYICGGSTMVNIKGKYKPLHNYKILKSSLHKLEIFIRFFFTKE